jgi:hypothetical protein
LILANDFTLSFQSDSGLRSHFNTKHHQEPQNHLALDEPAEELDSKIQQPYDRLHTIVRQLLEKVAVSSDSTLSSSLDAVLALELSALLTSTEQDNHSIATHIEQSEPLQHCVINHVNQLEQFIECYRFKAGCVKACIKRDGTQAAKPAPSVYAGYTSEC